MSTLSLRKIKHDSSAVDNITLDSNGRVGVQQASPNVPLEVSGSWRLGTNTSGTYTGGLGGGFNASNNIYSVYCRDRSDTNWNDLWIESKTMRLKVNGGDTAIYMDQSGRVTMPYQPAFMAIGDGRSAYGPGTDFIYGTTRFNIGNHYSTSTGRFTAPITGRYAFYANTMGDSTDARLMIRIVINGTDYHQGSSSSNGSQYQDSKLFVLAQLNAGDYVYVRNVGNKSTYDFNQLEQWFCGYLVS
jgi:C1q domain